MTAPLSVKVGLPPSAISFRRLFARASGEHVEALDSAGKRHRAVDVALGKMKAKSAAINAAPIKSRKPSASIAMVGLTIWPTVAANTRFCPVPPRSVINRYPCIANDRVTERRQIAVSRGRTRARDRLHVQTEIKIHTLRGQLQAGDISSASVYDCAECDTGAGGHCM